MNFINLMELLKNQIDYETFNKLHNDFMDEYSMEYKKIKPCKSTMEKAIKKYVSGVSMKDKKTATYTDGTTVLLLNKEIETENELKPVDLASKLVEEIKTKKPVDCYFMDSIALYKTLKKQEKQDYLLCIDGHYYSAEYIAKTVECIADKKEAYISAEITESGFLLLQQKYAAIVLPVNCKAVHVSKNVNMQDFLKYCDEIEKSFLDEITKSA